MLESKSFDIYKNAIVLIIVILGYSEVNTKISSKGMETAESDSCREVSGNNRGTNRVLAAVQEETRFFHKDKWKFINPFTQSISGLCWVSQLYPRTKE